MSIFYFLQSGLFLFLGIILLVVAFIQISNLRARISRLEKMSLDNKNTVKNETTTVSQPVNNANFAPVYNSTLQNNPSPVPSMTPYEIAEKARAADKIEDDVLSRFGVWFKQDWPLKVGAMLLIIGFGWLLTYAFQNHWIGPNGQIALGILLSMVFVGIGYWKIKDSISQGGSFLVVGSTGIIMTIFAAYNVYNMFSWGIALSGIFIASLFVTVASLLYKSKSLAVIGLILSSIAPIMVSGGAKSEVGLYLYLTVVVLSSIWVVFTTGWREMTLASLVIVSLYSFSFLSSGSIDHSADKNILLLINYGLVVVFYLANLASLVRYKEGNPGSDLSAAGINSFYFLGWTMAVVPTELQVLTIVAAAIIFAFGAFFVYMSTGRRESFLVYAGAGTMLLGVATTIQLHSQPEILIIAYTLEITVITLLSFLLSKSGELAKYVSGLFVIPAVMSLGYMTGYGWEYSTVLRNGLPKGFYVLSLLGGILFFLGLFIWSRSKNFDVKSSDNPIGVAMIVIGSVYAYVIIWLLTHALISESDAATFISMALYTVVGLATYSLGRINANKALTIYGSLMMIFVTARLLIVDIWQMESIVSRFVTFFGVGILFMSTAFLAKSKDKLIK